jgi:hypothetical protein
VRRINSAILRLSNQCAAGDVEASFSAFGRANWPREFANSCWIREHEWFVHTSQF